MSGLGGGKRRKSGCFCPRARGVGGPQAAGKKEQDAFWPRPSTAAVFRKASDALDVPPVALMRRSLWDKNAVSS